VFNNPFRYIDHDGQFIQFAIPLLIWGAELVLPSLSAYVAPIIYGAVTGAAIYGGHKAVQALNARDHASYSLSDDYTNYSTKVDESPKEEKKKKHSSTGEKRHTPDQEAISDLVKESGKKGVSNADADTLIDWAKEYDFPNRDDRGKRNEQGRPHWEGGEHIHLGPKHVKVNN